MKKISILLVLLGSFVPARAGNLTAAEAKNHIGENATVCGVIVSVHFASGSKGTPTFVNLDKPYPNHLHDFDLGRRPAELQGEPESLGWKKGVHHRQDRALFGRAGDYCENAGSNNSHNKMNDPALSLGTAGRGGK
jgi:hypothetical protein